MYVFMFYILTLLCFSNDSWWPHLVIGMTDIYESIVAMKLCSGRHRYNILRNSYNGLPVPSNRRVNSPSTLTGDIVTGNERVWTTEQSFLHISRNGSSLIHSILFSMKYDLMRCWTQARWEWPHPHPSHSTTIRIHPSQYWTQHGCWN